MAARWFSQPDPISLSWSAKHMTAARCVLLQEKICKRPGDKGVARGVPREVMERRQHSHSSQSAVAWQGCQSPVAVWVAGCCAGMCCS